uniref:Uncharacterized protein n=1 Tax=Anguilla anguilla TaxID=7936 RepID=A0A0E9R113_ANGAN
MKQAARVAGGSGGRSTEHNQTHSSKDRTSGIPSFLLPISHR